MAILFQPDGVVDHDGNTDSGERSLGKRLHRLVALEGQILPIIMIAENGMDAKRALSPAMAIDQSAEWT